MSLNGILSVISNHLPVIVDAFDQPILYYVASKHGTTSNMVEAKRLEDNNYARNQAQMKVWHYGIARSSASTSLSALPRYVVNRTAYAPSMTR